MAQQTFLLAAIPVDRDYTNTSELFFLGEKIMINWLNESDQGQWCAENLTNLKENLKFSINSNIDTYESIVHIKANLTPEEYTYYILRFGDKKKCVNN